MIGAFLGLLILLLLVLCSAGGVVMIIFGIKQKRPALWIGGIAVFLLPVFLIAGELLLRKLTLYL